MWLTTGNCLTLSGLFLQICPQKQVICLLIILAISNKWGYMDSDQETTLQFLWTEPSYIPFSPTNGKDQVNTSMKFGSQYGWGEQLNCLIFITLFSYFNTAARRERNKRHQPRACDWLPVTLSAFTACRAAHQLSTTWPSGSTWVLVLIGYSLEEVASHFSLKATPSAFPDTKVSW